MRAAWWMGGMATALLASGVASAAPQTAPVLARGTGIVRGADAKAGTITLDHEPILALHWPARTDTLKLVSPKLLRGVSIGQSVRVRINAQGVVTAVRPD